MKVINEPEYDIDIFDHTPPPESAQSSLGLMWQRYSPPVSWTPRVCAKHTTRDSSKRQVQTIIALISLKHAHFIQPNILRLQIFQPQRTHHTVKSLFTHEIRILVGDPVFRQWWFFFMKPLHRFMRCVYTESALEYFLEPRAQLALEVHRVKSKGKIAALDDDDDERDEVQATHKSGLTLIVDAKPHQCDSVEWIYKINSVRAYVWTHIVYMPLVGHHTVNCIGNWIVLKSCSKRWIRR